jgi:hypothetical protein
MINLALLLISLVFVPRLAISRDARTLQASEAWDDTGLSDRTSKGDVSAYDYAHASLQSRPGRLVHRCEVPLNPSCVASGRSDIFGVAMAFAKDNNALSTGRESGSQGFPGPVRFLSENVQYIGAGGHSVAIDANGAVWTWGRNDSNGGGGFGSNSLPDSGQLGFPREHADHTAGKLTDTNVMFTAVESGRYHAVAIGSDGRLYTWGLNDFGQLGREAYDSSGAACVSGSSCHDARVAVVNGVDEPVIALAAGRYHTVAATASGRVYTSGLNFCGNGQVRSISQSRVSEKGLGEALRSTMKMAFNLTIADFAHLKNVIYECRGWRRL